MENKCITLQGIIEFATSIRVNSYETTVESIINNFMESQELHPSSEKYHFGDKIGEGMINGNSIEAINNLFKDEKFIDHIYEKYSDNPLIKAILDTEYNNIIIKKCRLTLNNNESLFGLYLRSSQQPEIRTIIDFALQNPDIINNTEIDTIHHIDGQIITENLLVEGDMEYQWFSQDPINKVFTLQSSTTKTPFEDPADALNDMRKKSGESETSNTNEITKH